MCTYNTISSHTDHFEIQKKGFRRKVSKGAKIKNRYNQEPHLTQNTYGKVTNSQFDTTNESQEVSPFPAGDHKAHINRRAQGHSKHKTEKIKDLRQKNIKDLLTFANLFPSYSILEIQ